MVIVIHEWLWFQMADVLNNVYADVIDELLIIDCRYPYEFDGGHITVSQSVYL